MTAVVASLPPPPLPPFCRAARDACSASHNSARDACSKAVHQKSERSNNLIIFVVIVSAGLRKGVPSSASRRKGERGRGTEGRKEGREGGTEGGRDRGRGRGREEGGRRLRPRVAAERVVEIAVPGHDECRPPACDGWMAPTRLSPPSLTR